MDASRSKVSAYELLIDEFDGREFASYEEYESEIKQFVAGLEEELGKAERWACQNSSEIYEQLGVEVRE